MAEKINGVNLQKNYVKMVKKEDLADYLKGLDKTLNVEVEGRKDANGKDVKNEYYCASDGCVYCKLFISYVNNSQKCLTFTLMDEKYKKRVELETLKQKLSIAASTLDFATIAKLQPEIEALNAELNKKDAK